MPICRVELILSAVSHSSGRYINLPASELLVQFHYMVGNGATLSTFRKMNTLLKILSLNQFVLAYFKVTVIYYYNFFFFTKAISFLESNIEI